MKLVSKSPYKQNYIHYQVIKKKEIQPIIHNRKYSTARNNNPSELNDQKYAFNINQPNYNISINQKICTKKIPIPGKKIPILKRINKPIFINQNKNFGNVHNQNNFNNFNNVNNGQLEQVIEQVSPQIMNFKQ